MKKETLKIIECKGYRSQDLINLNLSGRKCILNFADHSRPGGTYDTDWVDWAQEETLCRDIPGLYEDLVKHKKEYLQNYYYTTFGDRNYDVLSAAAPLVGDMYEGAKKILDIMEKHNIDWPIIGWWGCGVYRRFKGDCFKAFRKALDEGNYSFKGILWPNI